MTCVLLVLNGLLVAAVYGTISLLAPALFKQPKFAQAVMFVAPVALLFVEWWLMDRLAERRT